MAVTPVRTDPRIIEAGLLPEYNEINLNFFSKKITPQECVDQRWELLKRAIIILTNADNALKEATVIMPKTNKENKNDK